MRVILKVDDFWGHKTFNNPVFRMFFDGINSLKLKISLGVVGYGLSCNDVVDDFNSWNHVELFNHSYWHMLNPRVISEFYNTSVAYQVKSIKMTDDLIFAATGKHMETIGFVANSFDENTLIALGEFSWIKNIYTVRSNDLYGRLRDYALVNGKNILDVNLICPIEIRGVSLRVDHNLFVSAFESAEKDNTIVLQLHPAEWDQNSVNEFFKIIEYLKNKGCEFIFPSEI